MGIMLPVIMLLGGVPPQEMGAIVAQRLACLDKLVVEYAYREYRVPSDVPPLTRDAWEFESTLPDGFQHRITIVRPAALDEFLTDMGGWVPVHYSVYGSGVVSRHVRPTSSGRVFYEVSNYVNHGGFNWTPALDVFDIHIMDSTIPSFNLQRIFEETDVSLVRWVGDVSTYTATQEMALGMTQHCEFDLSTRGTPLRIKTILEWSRPDGTPVAVSHEQFTLATEEVNGAELATEVAIVTAPPAQAGLDCVGIALIEVTSVELHPELTADDVRIEPVHQNSVINTWDYFSENKLTSQAYDENGQLIVHNPGSVSRPHYAWRGAVPWVAVAVGLGTALGLVYLGRQRA